MIPMSNYHLTDSQAQAVGLRSTAMLVSAAAGSGKTMVLTERLMARILEGEDIDRFLVITFTRAAAAELRGRILTQLNERIALHPHDAHLRRQNDRLYQAQIGTIDSYCADLVRENAHILGVSPGFAVLDEDRAKTILEKSLEEVLERAYERVGTDEPLRMLVDSVGAGRDDSALAQTVLDLYEKMRSYPMPWNWAEEALKKLDVRGLNDAAQTPWGKEILEDVKAESLFQAERLEKTADHIQKTPGLEPLARGYGDAFMQLAAQFRNMASASGESWDIARSLSAADTPRLKPVRVYTEEKDAAKDIWDSAKDSWKSMGSSLLGDSTSLLRDIGQTQAPMQALVQLTRELDEEYMRRKRRAQSYDFADLEHLCIQILCDDANGATELAKSVSQRFAEVMVDEYQDVNQIQETIFLRVSDEGKHLFMVGDVKQSIYRFRMAEPGIFNSKYAAFGQGVGGALVMLQENFRSRASILSACNGVFSKIMSPELGEVNYNEDAKLIPGASYPPEGEEKPELCVIKENAGDKEAAYVARRIREMVEEKQTFISDGAGGIRPVGYGDIAVLLRTPRTTGGIFRKALQEEGVPVSARQGGDFFRQPEVSFVLSMLSVVDNPRQDVPLAAALRGLPFGFTPDQLTQVRSAEKGDLWDALVSRAQEDENCRRFVDVVKELRSFAREEPTDSVLRRLYDLTNLMTICSAMSDAPRRTAELMQLYEFARRFEQSSGRGLFRFVNWLRDMDSRGEEPPMAAAGDSVQIMSIHKSKGLEFPVVFLVNTGHGWNPREGQVLCHSRLGLGMKITDAERGVRWPTLAYRGIALVEDREELSEQERVLYVAMTRARERLIITGSNRSAGKLISSTTADRESSLHPRILMKAKNAAEWLIKAATADDSATIRLVQPDFGLTEGEKEEEGTLPEADPELTETIRQRLSWQYPYENAVSLPSKLTATAVSQLMAREDDPESEMLVRERVGRNRFRRPNFHHRQRPLTGAERGIAVHAVMEHIDLTRTGSAEEIEEEIQRIREAGFLDENQAKAVNPEGILSFFRSEWGQRMRKAEHVEREYRFSLLCPANTWYEKAPEDEQILLQGVVDCCLEENGWLTILDFKTDATVQPQRYTGQLQAYASAMNRIFQKPVKQAVLWYLAHSTAVEVPLS